MSTAPVGDCRYPTTALGGVTTATSAQAAAWARASSRRSRTSSTPAPRCPLAPRVRSCRSSTWHEGWLAEAESGSPPEDAVGRESGAVSFCVEAQTALRQTFLTELLAED